MLTAILGGPLVFFGLLAMGQAGYFDNATENFWLIVGIGLFLIILWWVAVLYLGSRSNTDRINEENLGG